VLESLPTQLTAPRTIRALGYEYPIIFSKCNSAHIVYMAMVKLAIDAPTHDFHPSHSKMSTEVQMSDMRLHIQLTILTLIPIPPPFKGARIAYSSIGGKWVL
jgi:hypothetical protein